MTDEQRIKITAIEVSDQYCKDILVTCVEGGSNYWASFRNIIRDGELDILECEVADIEEGPDDPEEEFEYKKITIEDIRRGVQIVCDPKFKIGQEWRDMILNDDNDAGSSDIVLQAAIFGEVVYS